MKETTLESLAWANKGKPPPAGPQWLRGLQPLEPHALAYDKSLRLARWVQLACRDVRGRHRPGGTRGAPAYLLRPPVAQERVHLRPDGLVRITLKKAYADGTVAVDMDPLSLLSRLATSVPPPRFHTVRYASVLASASSWRSRIAPKPPPEAPAATGESETPKPTGGYRPWAELLARTFGVDVLACPKCQGRLKLLAMVTAPESIARYLAAVGEATEVPRRSENRGPPYWKSRLLRRLALGDEDGCHRGGIDEAP
jgi:hypothetical protein